MSPVEYAGGKRFIRAYIAVCLQIHCNPSKLGKERKRIYIAPFIYYVYLKALRHGSHSFTCKYTMPAWCMRSPDGATSH